MFLRVQSLLTRFCLNADLFTLFRTLLERAPIVFRLIEELIFESISLIAVSLALLHPCQPLIPTTSAIGLLFSPIWCLPSIRPSSLCRRFTFLFAIYFWDNRPLQSLSAPFLHSCKHPFAFLFHELILVISCPMIFNCVVHLLFFFTGLMSNLL